MEKEAVEETAPPLPPSYIVEPRGGRGGRGGEAPAGNGVGIGFVYPTVAAQPPPPPPTAAAGDAGAAADVAVAPSPAAQPPVRSLVAYDDTDSD